MDVTMPDGTLVQGVPDGITKSQLLAKYNAFSQPKQPDTSGDVGKSFVGGLERGAAAMPMVLPNLINQVAEGPQLLGRGIAENIDKTIGIEPQPRGDLWHPFYGSEDVLKMLPENMQPHTPQTAMGGAADILGQFGGNIAAGKVITSPTTAKFVTSEESGVSPGLATGGATTLADSTASGIKNMSKGASARTPDQLDEVTANIKSAASDSYKAMRDAGAVLKPEAANRIVDTVKADVEATGPLQKDLHSGYIGVMKDFQKAVKSEDFDLEQADQYRQLFRDVADRGKGNGDSMKANTAIKAIDKVVNRLGKNDIVNGDDTAVQSLLQGRAAWAKASRFDEIANIVRRSGGNINKLKADMFKFASNKNNIRGWSPEEINALKEAARNSSGEALMKMFGSLGFDIQKPVSGGSNVIPALETVAAVGNSAFGGGAPMAAPMLIGGTAAKTTQGMLGRGKVENLLQTIERRKFP